MLGVICTAYEKCLTDLEQNKVFQSFVAIKRKLETRLFTAFSLCVYHHL